MPQPIARTPIARIIVQPLVLADSAPEDAAMLRAHRCEIEALVPQRLAGLGPAVASPLAVEIDWDAGPGRAGAWGLAAVTWGGAVLPHGDALLHRLRAEAQAAVRAACARWE